MKKNKKLQNSVTAEIILTLNVNSDRLNHVKRMKTCSMHEEIMFKHNNGM